jgi:hypothetical protein
MCVASNRALYWIAGTVLWFCSLIGCVGCTDGNVMPLDAMDAGGQTSATGNSGHSGNAGPGRAGAGGDDSRSNGCRSDGSGDDESDADQQIDEAFFDSINDAISKGQFMLCVTRPLVAYPQQRCDARMKARTAAQTAGTPQPWQILAPNTLVFTARAASSEEALTDLLNAALDPRVCYSLSFTVSALVGHFGDDSGTVWVVEFRAQ